MMRFFDLGLIDYQSAWTLQERYHQQVLQGQPPAVLLLEHPTVITLGRRAEDSLRNLIMPEEALAKLGVQLVPSDRGGDITLHHPGQLVIYPILRIADLKLSVGGYVHRLEKIVIDVLEGLGIQGYATPEAPGVWVGKEKTAAKICALGVRIRQGVSLHGLALNLSNDLSQFNLINPCGLSKPVTSIQSLLQDKLPSMPELKKRMQESMQKMLDQSA